MVISSESDTSSSIRSAPCSALDVTNEAEVVLPQAVKRKRPSPKKPDPPGSTLSDRESLDGLITQFHVLEGVEFIVPNPNQRADHPPEGFFTLYEAYLRRSLLWFPIPSVILEFLWRRHTAIAQITPLGMRHLLGIMVRSYECGREVRVDHLSNYLKITRTGGKGAPTRTEKLPRDLFDLCAELAAEKCSWKNDFSRPRVREALARCPRNTPSDSLLKMSNNGKELSAREKRAIEARIGSNTRVSQRVGLSTPAPEVDAAAAPRSRRPDLERNVVVATDNQPKPLQKHHDVTQKKTMAWRGAANVLEKVQREKPLLETARDAKLAASRLSQIISTDVHFPLPEQMAQKDAYSDMALRCMTFLSSLNQLARGYELDARSQTRKLAATEKARDDYMGQKKDLEKQVATLQEVVKTTNDKRCKIDETFTKSESERKCLQQEVADLKNRLSLQDASVQQAVEKAKRVMATKYEDNIGRANMKIKLINDTLRVNIVLLAEVRSNIDLVGLLKKGEVPDLDAELVALKKQEAGLLSATDEFAFHMGKLEDILKDLSAGGTDCRVVDAEADAVPASSSSGSSGDEDSDSTTGGPP
ncbi:hypothetical protein AALP_AAs40836U000300 [Arabis alpina]|uniref:Uncharacterized protein n=1 Tax=Arabis alpina TaxID=50452 RepID=A0A087FWU8_ARAAL|nr:hypothetical protein AALP_AAs40836U000300 [Arabis alpina]